MGDRIKKYGSAERVAVFLCLSDIDFDTAESGMPGANASVKNLTWILKTNPKLSQSVDGWVKLLLPTNATTCFVKKLEVGLNCFSIVALLLAGDLTPAMILFKDYVARGIVYKPNHLREPSFYKLESPLP